MQFQKVSLFPALHVSAQAQTCPMALCLGNGAMVIPGVFCKGFFWSRTQFLCVQVHLHWSGHGGIQHRAAPVSPADMKGHPAGHGSAWPGCVFSPWGHHSPLGVIVCLTVYPKQLLFHFGLKLINQGDFGERNNSFPRICIILAGDMIMVFVKDRTQ